MTRFFLLTKSWKRENHLLDTVLLLLIALLILTYVIAFPHLMKSLGPAIRLFASVYILLAALAWGLWGGLAVCAINIIINWFLHNQTGYTFEGGLIGPLAGLLTIVMVGRISDLSRQLSAKLVEREQAEDQLRINEEKYRQLFEMESDSLALIETDTTRIIEVNKAATELFRYSREELLRTKAIKLSAEPEKTLASIKAQHQKIPIRYLRKKDGTVFPTEISARHFELQGNKVFLLAIRDISGRVEAIKERLLVDKQFRQTQKLEAIGTLAGGIAHDFNNILGAILGYTDLLLMQETSQNRKWVSYLEQIRKSTNRAKDLIYQILTFSRQAEVSKKPFMVKPVVKEALKLLRASIPTRIEIKQNINADKDTIIADPTQIHQIIVNLCTNASHAIGNNDGIIEVAVKNVFLDKSFAARQPAIEPGRYIEISVKDSGHGIPSEILGQIFHPYFSTKKDKGSGLGLSVVHGIVLSHNGCITVESEPEKGAIFKAFFPLAFVDVDSIEKVATKIKNGSEKILLIDDEPVLAGLVKEMLELMGYVVESRTSSIEALELFRAKPYYFDLIITDMNMPNITGIELCREIVQMAPKMPMIICTGFSEDIDEEKAIEFGFKKMLMKPVSFHALATAVGEILDNTNSSTERFTPSF